MSKSSDAPCELLGAPLGTMKKRHRKEKGGAPFFFAVSLLHGAPFLTPFAYVPHRGPLGGMRRGATIPGVKCLLKKEPGKPGKNVRNRWCRFRLRVTPIMVDFYPARGLGRFRAMPFFWPGRCLFLGGEDLEPNTFDPGAAFFLGGEDLERSVTRDACWRRDDWGRGKGLLGWRGVGPSPQWSF